jgi:protein-disulfide isomerase
MPPVDSATDYIRGPKNARVTVVTYSDFECPFSKRHHPTLAQILDAYKNDVNVVYRHFPLSFHQNAQKEAEAAECVGSLAGNDAFWKFTDAVYEKTTSNGTGFPLDQLAPLAKSLGVNEAAFTSCLDSGKFAQKVKDEETSGASAGVEGTPGNFVVDNKTKKTTIVSGAQPLSAFQTAIDAILK